MAFRDGRRRYPPMNYLLKFLPDAYLAAMAEYFAAQRPPLPPRAIPIVSQEVLARGQSIVTHGDPQRGIPACAGCHGPSFTGMEPAIPGLVGLNARYISAQLGAWRYGTRTTAAPDCMQIVAGLLTEADVTAVAAYLSSLPIPRRSRAGRYPCRWPAAANRTEGRQNCGILDRLSADSGSGRRQSRCSRCCTCRRWQMRIS